MHTGEVKRTLKTAELLKGLPTTVSKDSIRRWAREGRLPCDATPGGHRRYNLEEVLAAINAGNRSHFTPLAVGPGKTHIGKGPTPSTSQAHALERLLSQVETVPSTNADVPDVPETHQNTSAVSELLGHARRILVAAGG
jgi:hypothetical protein